MTKPRGKKKSNNNKKNKTRIKIDALTTLLKVLKGFDTHTVTDLQLFVAAEAFCATGGQIEGVPAAKVNARAFGALLQFKPGVENLSIRGDGLSNSQVAIKEEGGSWKRTYVSQSDVRDIMMHGAAPLFLAESLLSTGDHGFSLSNSFCEDMLVKFGGFDSTLLWLKDHGPACCTYPGTSSMITFHCLKLMSMFSTLDLIADRFAAHDLFTECVQIPIRTTFRAKLRSSILYFLYSHVEILYFAYIHVYSGIIESASVNDDQDLQMYARLFLQNMVGRLPVLARMIPTTMPDVHELSNRLLLAVATQVNDIAHKLRHTGMPQQEDKDRFGAAVAQFAALLVNGWGGCCKSHVSLGAEWLSKACQSGVHNALFNVLQADLAQCLDLVSVRVTIHALECLSSSAAFYPQEKQNVVGNRAECAICLEGLEQAESMQLPCSHRFHLSCYRELAGIDLADAESTVSVRCPMCRDKMKHHVHLGTSDGEERVKLQHQISYRDTDSSFCDNFLLCFAMARFHADATVRARASITVGGMIVHIVKNQITEPLRGVILFPPVTSPTVFDEVLPACAGQMARSEVRSVVLTNSLIHLTDVGEARMRKIAVSKCYPITYGSQFHGRLTIAFYKALSAYFGLVPPYIPRTAPFVVEYGDANDADNHPSMTQLANDLFELLDSRKFCQEISTSDDSGVMLSSPKRLGKSS